MEHFIRSIQKHFSLSHDFFHSKNEQIATANIHTLKRASTLSCIIMSCSIPILIAYHYSTYIILFIGLTIALHVTVYQLAMNEAHYLLHHPRKLRWLCVGYQSSLLLLITIISIFVTRDDPGLFFAPMAIITSLVFIIPPWQSITGILASSSIFAVLSILQKSWHNSRLDIVIAIFTIIMSLILVHEFFIVRKQNLILRSELLHLSSIDSLTGLMNKKTAEASARQYLKRHGDVEGSALMVVDMDQFKQINDIMGHQVGDAALEIFGNKLTRLFRSQDIVGRVGGDEFMILMKNVTHTDMVCQRAQAICDAVQEMRLQGFDRSLTCSVGIALCPAHGKDYDVLFQKADEQLYHLKRGERNGYSIVSLEQPAF